ncbi:hypothetical protein ATN79_07725 [Paraburkholderia caribensis]|nr:hypothetical protein ATN79_07725 [Paraburkholderia caribensis]
MAFPHSEAPPLTYVRLPTYAHPHNTSVATCEAGTASIRITSPIEFVRAQRQNRLIGSRSIPCAREVAIRKLNGNQIAAPVAFEPFATAAMQHEMAAIGRKRCVDALQVLDDLDTHLHFMQMRDRKR